MHSHPTRKEELWGVRSGVNKKQMEAAAKKLHSIDFTIPYGLLMTPLAPTYAKTSRIITLNQLLVQHKSAEGWRSPLILKP